MENPTSDLLWKKQILKSKIKYYAVHDPRKDGVFAYLIESCNGVENCVGMYGSWKRAKKGVKERMSPNTLRRAQRRADRLNKQGSP